MFPFRLEGRLIALALLSTTFALALVVPGSAEAVRKQCSEKYQAAKAAGTLSGQTWPQFYSQCAAEGQTTPARQQTTVPAVPSAAPPTTRTQAPAPKPTTAARPSGDGSYSHMPPGAPANEYATEEDAKVHCARATVVWVNTNSKVYHFAGTHNYGHTKEGAFMCENEAQAAGARASETERHP
jgi:hypothetical protein